MIKIKYLARKFVCLNFIVQLLFHWYGGERYYCRARLFGSRLGIP
jgi:hypothetical protein